MIDVYQAFGLLEGYLSKDVGLNSGTPSKTWQAPTSPAPGTTTSYILLGSLAFVGLKPSGGISNNSGCSDLDIVQIHELPRMSKEAPQSEQSVWAQCSREVDGREGK